MSNAPRGGTEIQYALWQKYISSTLQQSIHLSLSAILKPKRPLKPHIFWAHQAVDQPSVQNLHDPLVRTGIDAYVFVSEWQRAQYLRHFLLPADHTYVITNAIEPISIHTKPSAPLRLIYTSTPFRGLDVLLDSFAGLSDTHSVELHIYSGMSLYGRPEEDQRFGELYQRAQQLHNVHYHGVVPNSVIREALKTAHIFAYPCTWEETSCIALIEALCAGCYVVAPKLGALLETAHSYGDLYQYESDKKKHSRRFRYELERVINCYHSTAVQNRLAKQVQDCNQIYSWEVRRLEWESILRDIIVKYGRAI